MWRTRQLPNTIKIVDGLKVLAYGRVVVWEQGGRYQFDVYQILPAGLGELQAAFEALKAKLAKEGLFSIARKRPLPRYPRAIGIVTSKVGAAIYDFVWGFTERYPPAELYLIPVAVQGETAAPEIASAIELFNKLNIVDVIVVGRGGGSMEDLWAFNEEIVVRSIVNSSIPIVSAVGHEVDVSLSDLAADVRAPTPTAAASLVVPDRKELLEALSITRYRLKRALERVIQNWRDKIKSIKESYGFKRIGGRLIEERMRLEVISQRIDSILRNRLELLRQRLQNQREKLHTLSPSAVLDRGYCLICHQDNSLVRSAKELKIQEDIYLNFSQDKAKASVKEIYIDVPKY